MKNFSEATAIKANTKLKLVLELKSINLCPCIIVINDQLEVFGNLVGNNMFIKEVGISDPINITITVDRQHPQAIEITKLTIDGREVLPLYLNNSNPPTNYLDTTGTWSLTIPNFYPWYHTITGQGWII